MNLVGEDNEAFHRTPPLNPRVSILVAEDIVLLAECVPREDAVAVCKQQPVYLKITANGKYSILLTVAWVGEIDVIRI